MVVLESPLDTFVRYTKKLGLKNTRQRELIVLEFFRVHDHVSAEELCQRVRKIDARVSLATVYRALKLLQECGLAQSHHFGKGTARFESTLLSAEHHDHLICLNCSRIVEFVDEEIERLQNEVAKARGFVVRYHRMELYGMCHRCQNAS